MMFDKYEGNFEKFEKTLNGNTMLFLKNCKYIDVLEGCNIKRFCKFNQMKFLIGKNFNIVEKIRKLNANTLVQIKLIVASNSNKKMIEEITIC